MSLYRKFASLAAALILTLSLAGSAFADTSTGDTPETLTVNATISATFPAAFTYTLTADQGAGGSGQDFYSGIKYVTIVSSNNPSGVNIRVKVDPWAGPGAITVPTTKRFTVLDNDAVTGSGAALTSAAGALPLGTFVNNTTSVLLASSTAQLAGRRIGIEYAVDASEFAVAGDYTSAAHYTAATNP